VLPATTSNDLTWRLKGPVPPVPLKRYTIRITRFDQLEAHVMRSRGLIRQAHSEGSHPEAKAFASFKLVAAFSILSAFALTQGVPH